MEPKNTVPHGGDWAGYQAAYGTRPLDFSANVSPLGVPPGVLQAVTDAVSEADRYPDPLCRALRAALAEKEGVPAEAILCGNGAADLIFRVVLACRPRAALLAVPGFAEYQNALELVGCAIEPYCLTEENGFRLKDDFLEAITKQIDLVFLCEPHNPTGRTSSLAFLQRVLRRCTEIGALLVVDACFEDFLEQPNTQLLQRGLMQNPHLLLLKAFTKQYAMAGIRLGYVLSSNVALLEQMRSAGQPWPVSSLAQAAGMAALQEETYCREVRTLVQAERPWLQSQLQQLGCLVIPGEANYLLFRSPLPLGPALAARGILLRSCGNFRGLDETWYRTAVRRHEENIRLIAAVKEVLDT